MKYVIATHLTPGPKEQQNPYRAELAGILASVIMVEEECRKRNVTTATITIGCDCETALGTYLYCRKNRPSPSSKHYDITSQMFTLLHKSTFVWEGKDIMAHQDDIKLYEELDVWEQWNVDADLFAKNHWAESEETPYYNLLPFDDHPYGATGNASPRGTRQNCTGTCINQKLFKTFQRRHTNGQISTRTVARK